MRAEKSQFLVNIFQEVSSFWQILRKKSRFFGARFPFKINIYCRFSKTLGPVSQNRFLKIVTKEAGTFGSAEGQIPKRVGRPLNLLTD